MYHFGRRMGKTACSENMIRGKVKYSDVSDR